MKKSLEKSYDALNKITYCYGYDKNIEIVNNELKRLEELDKEFELEHSLRVRTESINWDCYKVLDIIKSKELDAHTFFISKNVEDYNLMVKHENALSKEQYKMLKDYLM